MNVQQFFAWIKEKGFNLTEAQRKAVVYDMGPLLLLAVPGAGKTTVLILRLAYLVLVINVNPERILCLTFGRAAAKEMSDRFTQNFGNDIGNIHFSTIHSYAYEVVRAAFRQKGRDYQIIEELTGVESKSGVLRGLFKQINTSTLTEDTLEELQNAICFVKNSLISPEKLENVAVKNFVTIYNDYEKYKRMHQPQLIDFDDMLSIAYTALVENPRLLEMYQKRFDYILTDESQDTSLLQHKIIELISKPKQNLFVVGDDDQSIFGFRAAEPKYLLEFPQVYDQAEILRMEQNFRSTPEIVSISREFIRSNKMRYDKEMVTENVPGETVQIEIFKGNKEQNEFILGELINKGVAKSAVLYRNNLSVITLVDELDRGGVPFYIRDSNKERFFSHWVVKDILNFLRFSYSDQNVAVLDTIKSKFETYISKAQIEYLRGIKIDRSIFEILSEQQEGKSRQSGYFTLKEQFKSLNKLPPSKAVGYIRNELGYDKVIERICKNLGFSKEHLNSLLSILETIAARELTLPDFANRLSYLEEKIKTSYKNKGTKAVTLSTIHSAKGLEWERVYLIDLIQGIIPDLEAVKNAANNKMEAIEEERRLFYVAMTRAQKHLTLCTMKQYLKQIAKRSQFVQEVQALLEVELQRKRVEDARIVREEREELLRLSQAEREELLRLAQVEQEKSERIAKEEQEKRRAGDFEFHLAKREGFFNGLTEKEEVFFLELCEKHGYTEDSFPGIFDVEVEHSSLIQTPAKVWQLWIYDRCIYKKKDSELLYITAIYDRSVRRIYDFIKLQDEGVFRTSNDSIYKFALIEVLLNLGIVSRVEVRHYKILINEIPIYNDRKENVLIKICLDNQDYACENVKTLIALLQKDNNHIRV
ncbi:UvrD/REP helicase family protein (modular protein) [Candidatus Desulfosporosinus infrequens]|uniref:DNA 3'-5' helicase n=1 Tax=Candidatus Desulfosporosinus infrequens TaxID=2043169 RepID=A0A2U3LXU8_9FIRM|nr:UvrD/REP helicase family protein (modular protein) [Candidatus Desulfosporosinus infrequens]